MGLPTDLVLVKALSLARGRLTADGNGTGVDCSKLDGKGCLLVDVANVSGTTPTCDGHAEHSSDDGVADAYATMKTPAAVDAAITQVTTVAGIQKIPIDWSAAKAFVRWVDDVSGTSPVYDRNVKALGYQKSSTA